MQRAKSAPLFYHGGHTYLRWSKSFARRSSPGGEAATKVIYRRFEAVKVVVKDSYIWRNETLDINFSLANAPRGKENKSACQMFGDFGACPL